MEVNTTINGFKGYCMINLVLLTTMNCYLCSSLAKTFSKMRFGYIVRVEWGIARQIKDEMALTSKDI